MYKKLFVFFLPVFLFACHPEEMPPSGGGNGNPDTTTVVLPPLPTSIFGYNVRWPDLADFDNSAVLALADSLSPRMLRYPGGTLAHKWEWKEGIIPGTSNTPHFIGDVKRMADATGCNMTFVLDIINHSLSDQVEMLKSANVPIEYLELGNELYSDDYENTFPNGAAYAMLVNQWTPTLRQEFPNAKIGAVMIGRTGGDDRKKQWNQLVHENISVGVDAYIYHIYVGETETVDERMVRFYEQFLPNTGKELWITEYGTHSQNPVQAIELATLVDSIAEVSLNHSMVTGSGNFSKMSQDCNHLTAEGQAFVKRYYR